MQYGERWARIVRAESNIITPDDPPTAPLPETHELGEGQSDFSNFVDKNEDVSTSQALGGLGAILAFCYGIYQYSTYRARSNTPVFKPREFPDVEKDMPTWPGASKVPR